MIPENLSTQPEQPATSVSNLPTSQNPQETSSTDNPENSSTNTPMEPTNASVTSSEATNLPDSTTFKPSTEEVPQTTAIQQEETTTDSTVSSNALGTLCSTNTTGAWLDLVFVLDTSAVFTTTKLNQFGGLIAGLLRRFTIDQNIERSTRIAIITYATRISCTI
uniref:VWFA domain-containing protein n=1 Tax=Panagrolaimus superbus TaxID=310955 RepID=A0A914Y6C3_9BILA